MAQKVILPHWGMEILEGTVVRWLKKEGDAVQKGDPLVEIETHKALGELESPAPGILARILVSEGATVGIGTVLALIAEPRETVESSPSRSGGPPPGEKGKAEDHAAFSPVVQVEPAARKLARERNIDLGSIRGSGPGGRITVEDVAGAVAAGGTPPPAAAGPVELTGIRRIIATRMVRSSQETAAVTLTAEADVTLLEESRQRLRQQHVDRLAVIVKAVAMGLKQHPYLNARLHQFRLQVLREVNVGVAVALEDGLVVPVIKQADRKTAQEVTREIRRLWTTAQAGKLTPDETTGGTFTVTSLGAQGIDTFTPILNQPEVGILGVGRIQQKPGVHQGQIVPRAFMWLSLTFDHRACDGAPAARFLLTVRQRLEDPGWLFATG